MTALAFNAQNEKHIYQLDSVLRYEIKHCHRELYFPG